MKTSLKLIIFSVLLLIGIFVCVICDRAITGTFTWSLIPISSIIFAWLILFPIISFGKKGICDSLVILSLSILPYLYVLDHLIPTDGFIFAIGSQTAIIGIIYLWCIFALSKFLKNKYKIISLSLLLAIPLCIFINLALHEFTGEPIIDLCDIFTTIGLFVLACIFLVIDFTKQRAKVK